MSSLLAFGQFTRVFNIFLLHITVACLFEGKVISLWLGLTIAFAIYNGLLQ